MLDLSSAEFLEGLYWSWLEDPQSVPEEWRSYFASLGEESGNGGPYPGPIPPTHPAAGGGNGHAAGAVAAAPGQAPAETVPPGGAAPDLAVYRQSRVESLIWAYRDVGYIYAHLNPLENYTTPELKYMYITMEGNYESLTLESFGLSEDDLDEEVNTGRYFEPKRAPLRQLLRMLRRTYCGSLGAEILHIQNKPMRRWLIEHLESPERQPKWDRERRTRFQKDLIKAEELERFIHSNFIGQKRFSLEGGEALIPALRYIVEAAPEHGVQELVLGMAHRGRLNVLTNVMRKQPAETFSHFTENYMPHTYGGSGDVKYHLGHSTDVDAENGRTVHVSLVANPSHLESVDPVVEGKTRGIQRRRGDRNRKKVMPILIHGDAAFSGQGVVAETLNLSQLKGYRTGGTVHIILNNQIGFTTASRDARSTFFATDIAKSMPVPILHANGDDIEAVLHAIDLALRYRQKFGYDAVVDILCYRRLGHNEADEPSFTHPIMYSIIKNHESVTTRYGKQVAENGVMPKEDQDAFRDQYKKALKNELEKAKQGYEPHLDDAFERGEWADINREYTFEPADTSVAKERLRKIGEVLTTIPEDFHVHPKLKRFVKDRSERVESGQDFDWALAESMAFGSLLLEGHRVRLSGEDSGRGTFSQRHTVWWDAETEVPTTYVPLQHIEEEQGAFSVYDSPLSEFAVLGFDYGYSIAQPNCLVLWEAQFGDFVNGAQVIIDQFIAAGESKWFRSSGLVMLLPHGYAGQGPEHSSAHLERFLQLSAEDNLQVVNLTTPAQYFHALRNQIHAPYRKPLIVMSPKSLLRHKACVSTLDDLAAGTFRHVLDDTGGGPGGGAAGATGEVKRLILCSGKVYYDLDARRQERERTDVAIVRIEQLYPFPEHDIREIISRYDDADEVVWCQEEPENRGAFSFVRGPIGDILSDTGRRLTYAGRPRSASPATGSHAQHTEELKRLLDEAFAETEQND
ncbi:MAG: 2-oxoglutarate dehydrogenase E1 component [Spirochaetes bacterium]|jgi:2-oxoglutarate dehydrogenase E1 component|nr:2-oxoglutarate dehydrogenase E1 component [Spirochaetota bacterium]